jgi:hypothetical protein
MIIHNDDDSYHPSITPPLINIPSDALTERLIKENRSLQSRIDYLTYINYSLRKDVEYLRKQLDRLEADVKPGMDEAIRIRYLTPDGKDLTCYTQRGFLEEDLFKLLCAMKCNILEVIPTGDSKICAATQENWVVTWISVYTKMPKDWDATYLVRKANGEIGIAEYRTYFGDRFPTWVIYRNDNADYIDIDDKSDNRVTDWAPIPMPTLEPNIKGEES